MNSPDPQPGPDSPGFEQDEYFDPDMPDASEQRFSASLDAPAERPRFVVDGPDGTGMPSRVEEGAAIRREGLGEASGPAATSEPTPSTETETRESDAGVVESDWRNLVSAKVSRYRSRKPRQERYPSLQLHFEVSPLRDRPSPIVAHGPVEAKEWAEDSEAQAPREAPVVMEATARVLEFPRPMLLPSREEELAEPVLARPRIVEAPELLPPPPALGGILIEPIAADETDRLPGLDVPLQSSPFSRRLLAGVIDVLVVAIALAAFGYIFFRMNGVPPLRSSAGMIALLLAVLWTAYQYAFLVLSKATPGLRLAKLEVRRFDGGPPSRSLRRWRVVASLLSCASLGLGYAWCFLDEDQLSWHDRITRTHLGSAPRAQKP